MQLRLPNKTAAGPSLKFIGKYTIPYNSAFENTTVGGLSGIDYDSASGAFYLICDDRSAINPARFYTANIQLADSGFKAVNLTGVHSLLQQDGSVYPNFKTNKRGAPDPEAIRYNPRTNELVWSSEGERIVSKNDTVLVDPSINIITKDGKWKGSFSLPANLKMHISEKGPRQNGVLEGMSFSGDYSKLFVNVEEPLFEDGPRAEVAKNNATIRILVFDAINKNNVAQYAYPLDAVAHPAFPASGFKLNGVPDILFYNENQLIVIERSFSTGRLACTIKVFLADLSLSTDIKSIVSLNENTSYKTATKKLLLNMDSLGIYIDNIEGVTFGPLLHNGHRSLIFVADNNFNPLEQSQLLLFEIAE